MKKPNSRLPARATMGILILLLSWTCIAIDGEAYGQTYAIRNWVFGNGGGRINGGGYLIHVTIGQPCVGVASNANYQIRSGIGHSVSGILWTRVVEDFDRTSTLPSSYRLDQNFPNPFNPTTIVGFAVPRKSWVSLALYNALGQRVVTLVESELSVGEYELALNGNELSSGVYLCRMMAGDFRQSRKLVVLK